MRGTALTETVPDMQVGDEGETLVAMNVRTEIDYKSEVVGLMPESCHFTVVETGANHRALVSSGNMTGWISTKTDLDQPLTKKVKEGTGALPVWEAAVQLSMRQYMDFKSEVLMSLPEGTQFELIEHGPQNRVKVFCDGVIGWITAQSDRDHPLIKELSPDVSARLAKNLDSYVARQVSQSQVTRVLTSGALGSQADRSMID